MEFLDFILTTVSLVVYVVDIIMDLIMFHDYYAQNAVLESSLTLTFVLLPSVVVFLDKFYRVSVITGIKDALLLPFNTIIIHGKLIYQYWYILRRNPDRDSQVEKLKNLKYEAIEYDFYESTFESLPQLFLQSILIMTDVHNNSLTEIIRVITMATSFLSISWGIMCYVSRCPCAFTKSSKCKEMSLWLKLLNFLGHVFVLGANVLALSFAAQIPQSTVPEVNTLLTVLIILCALAIRLLIMLTWRMCDDKENRVLESCSQTALIVFGICVPSKDGKFGFTYKSYILVFGCDFIQNSIFIVVWYLQTSLESKYKVAFIVSHYVFLTLGFCFMILFHWKFQPYITKTKRECNELPEVANGVAGNATVPQRREIENKVQSQIPENSGNVMRQRNMFF